MTKTTFERGRQDGIFTCSGEYQLLKQEQRAVIRQECDTAYNGVSEEFPEQAQQLPAFLFCQ